MERREPTFSNTNSTPNEPAGDHSRERPVADSRTDSQRADNQRIDNQRPDSRERAAGDSRQGGEYRGASRDSQEPSSRQTRQNTYAPQNNDKPAASNTLAAMALVVGLIAVGGAGFLGWQLLQAQEQLQKAEVRIGSLEQQLSLTSEESSASLVGLQANVKKLDADLRKLGANSEENRKAAAAANDKITVLTRDSAAIKKDASDAKAGLASLNQEITTSKTAVDAAIAKVDTMAGGVSKQAENLQALRERLDRMQLELAAVDNIAAKTRNNEAAIAAIDEFRRSTNRELLQIKQYVGLTPK